MRTAYLEWERSTLMDGRVRVPAAIRAAWERSNVQTMYLTHGLGGCIFVFSAAAWQVHVARFMTLPFSTPEAAEHLRQLFFLNAVIPVRSDAAGRIPISPALIAFARLRRSVVLVRRVDRVEIWDQGQWEAHLQQKG